MITNLSTNRLYLAGKFYGYPDCCITFFINRFEKLHFGENGLTRNQQTVHGNKGFIPCADCADKVARGEVTLQGLIQNRVCNEDFPASSFSGLTDYIQQQEPVYEQPALKMPEPEEEEEWQSLHDILRSKAFEKFLEDKGRLNSGLGSAQNYFQQLTAFKQFYLSKEQEIREAHHRNPKAWAQAYPCDWSRYLSPIELRAWQCIRAIGGIVLYPQYPALNYYLDFANPGYKIALELDGKAYHNKERDFIRDLELKKAGWTVYRITGSEMMNTDYLEWSEINELEYEDEQIDALRHWLLNTGDGVITALKQVYFTGCHDEARSEPGLYYHFWEACEASLHQHKS